MRVLAIERGRLKSPDGCVRGWLVRGLIQNDNLVCDAWITLHVHSASHCTGMRMQTSIFSSGDTEHQSRRGRGVGHDSGRGFSRAAAADNLVGGYYLSFAHGALPFQSLRGATSYDDAWLCF